MMVSDNAFWRTLRFLQFHRIFRILKFSSLAGARATDKESKQGSAPSENELETKFTLAWNRLLEMEVVPGDYLEFCESRGTTMACMLRVIGRLKLNNVRLVSVDTGQRYHRDNESMTLETKDNFKAPTKAAKGDVLSDESHLITASFDDISKRDAAKNLGLRKVSVIMIDCDSYASAKSALDFSGSLILDHAMIFINNSRSELKRGQDRAYSEFLRENDHLKSLSFRAYMPNGQIFCVTSTRLD
ncbi:MAG: hypothetical protein QM762_10275 [Chryseolinea sp.]